MDAAALQRELERLKERYAERPAGRSFAPLADCYRKLGQPEAALELLLPGLDRHPDYNAARVILGKVYLDRGDVASARLAFEQVLAQDPYNLLARRQAALLAESTGDWAAARAHWQALQAADRGSDEAGAALARIETAIAAAARPFAGRSSGRGDLPRADVLEAKLEPDPEPRIPVAQRAAAVGSEGIVTATLARIYREQGFARRALEIYEQLMRTHPEPAFEQAIRELRAELSKFSGSVPDSVDDLLTAPEPSLRPTPAPAAPAAVAAAATAPTVSAPTPPAAQEPKTDFDRFRTWLDRNKVRS